MRSLVVLATAWVGACFHDCVQTPAVVGRRRPPGGGAAARGAARGDAPCSGGLCVGMHGGPHEGGRASYPVGDAATGFTAVSSTMTVPALPAALDGITYYLWTDIFFGDMSLGRMNQVTLARASRSRSAREARSLDFRCLVGSRRAQHVCMCIYSPLSASPLDFPLLSPLYPCRACVGLMP